MQSGLRCVLDKEGLLHVPEDFTLVECETALWQAFVGSKPIWVRGNKELITWAAKALTGRGWIVETKSNQFGPLTEQFPFLEKHIAEIARRIGEADDCGSLSGIAKVTLNQVPLDEPGSSKHLLNFLLWDVGQNLDELQQAVRQALISVWNKHLVGDVSKAYLRLTQDTSKEHLIEWMSLSNESRRGKWLPFPGVSDEESLHLSKLASEATRDLILSGNANQIQEFLKSDVAASIKSIATKTVTEALKQNSDVLILNQELADLLIPFASLEQSDYLRKLIPPQKPGPLPDTLNNLAKWYQNEYLPYRQWSALTNDPTATDCLKDIWKIFSLWYLERLLPAINGGKGESELAFKMVRELWKQADDNPVLLIILDGLLPGDERSIADQIRKNNPDWEVTGKTFAATLVPTITEICKVSLIQGCPPMLSQNKFQEIRLRTDAIAATKNAIEEKKGYVIWASNEPDWTYHKKFDTPEITRYEVSKTISNIVSDITSLLSSMPKDCALKVVITSDHGRTIGGCPRCLPIPDGSRTHDRVVQIDGPYTCDSPYFIDDQDIIHINEEAFGVGTGTTMISSTDLVFSTYFKGNAWFVHGGILPEEAIVPWLTLARTKTETKINGSAKLDGILGRTCKLSIEFSNPSDIGLEFLRVRLSGGGIVPIIADLDMPLLKPLDSSNVELELPIEGEGVESLDMLVEVRKPSGEILSFSIPVDVNLRVMQGRSVDLNEDFNF